MESAIRTVTADRGDAGRRIDVVVQRHLADVSAASRTRVQRWIASGLVLINGRPARRASTRAAHGDKVTIRVPAADRRRVMEPEDAVLHVLYEDEALLAVDKPPGVVVHPTYRHDAGTIMNALLWRARTWPSPARPSLVGRLDRLTSGLLIVAKSPEVHRALQRNPMDKDYLAVVLGAPPRDLFAIDRPLARDGRDRRRVAIAESGGRPSLTWVERLSSSSGLSLVRCRLGSGRMHQIRVHLASAGWPIAGDPVYGDRERMRTTDAPVAGALAGLGRQALHAWRITCAHPVNGRRLSIESPVPADIQALLDAAGLSSCAPIGGHELSVHQP